jgi:TRAP-type C4-dicarboxylate transport system permease large subunit
MLEIFRAVLPFVAILLLAVLIITYWPALSLVLLKS